MFENSLQQWKFLSGTDHPAFGSQNAPLELFSAAGSALPQKIDDCAEQLKQKTSRSEIWMRIFQEALERSVGGTAQ